MSKLFQYGGIVASIVLIAFGAGSIITGYNGRDRVHNDLAREQIIGTPDSSIPNQLVNNGTKAEAFAKVMRKHTLEATGGKTYAEMPQDSPERDIWVTETALTTALYTSYFAENVALFAIIVGIVMLLVGIGFVVLTVFSRRGAAAGTPPPGAAT
jgi:hypothetical protein